MSPNLAGSDVLITGGAGFIGSNLAIRSLELGAKVTIVDSMIAKGGGNPFNLQPIEHEIEIDYADIRDRYSLDELVRGKDLIFHLAGQVGHLESMEYPFTDLDINTRGSLALLESCRRHNRDAVIVFASTRQIYGKAQYLPVDEKHPTSVVDVNGINKAAAEHYFTLYHRVYGIRSVSLRLTNTYGPRQRIKDNIQGFIAVFLRMAIDGKRIRVFGDGTQIRDFNYVDDVVSASIAVATEDCCAGNIYSLGAERHYSLLEFIEILRRTCDFEYELAPFPPDRESIDIGDYYADYSKLHEHTGWEPAVELEEGLLRTVEYYEMFKPHYW